MKSSRFNNYLPVNTSTTSIKEGAGVKIRLPSLPLVSDPKMPATNLFKLLRLGQQLDATVIKQFPAQKLLQLKIGSTLVNAQSALKLPIGTPIKIEVAQLGKIPQFKLISALPQLSQTISQAFKQALPRQIPLSSFLTQLQTALVDKKISALLPKQVTQLATKILTEIPQREQLSQPGTLKNLIQKSGIFLEKQLAQSTVTDTTTPALQGDRKARLVILLNTLRAVLKQPVSRQNSSSGKTDIVIATSLKTIASETIALKPELGSFIKAPPSSSPGAPQLSSLTPQLAAELKELIGKTEGAIAKIVLDQLASLPREESTRQTWQMELPFNNGSAQTGSVKLQITQEEGSASSEAEPSWSVVLEINPPGLGKIYSKIVLKSEGEQVDTYFWSDKPSTRALIDNNLNKLQQRFSSAGLESGKLGTQPGRPVEAEPKKPGDQLVSEQA